MKVRCSAIRVGVCTWSPHGAGIRCSGAKAAGARRPATRARLPAIWSIDRGWSLVGPRRVLRRPLAPSFCRWPTSHPACRALGHQSAPCAARQLLDPVLATSPRTCLAHRPALTGMAASPTTTCTSITARCWLPRRRWCSHPISSPMSPGWLDKALKRRHRATPFDNPRCCLCPTPTGWFARRQTAGPVRLHAPGRGHPADPLAPGGA